MYATDHNFTPPAWGLGTALLDTDTDLGKLQCMGLLSLRFQHLATPHSLHFLGCFSYFPQGILPQREMEGGLELPGSGNSENCYPCPRVGWFKSSPLGHDERDITDGVKRGKGASGVMK